ncbi:MAG: hypothetical protein ACI4TM_06595 [Candidatus Cryptobacteroides sp.]
MGERRFYYGNYLTTFVMYSRMLLLLAVWVPFVVSVSGCSVKENRSECPCVLMIDFSEVDADRFPSVILSAVAEGGIITGETSADSYSGCFMFSVPRKTSALNVTAIEGKSCVPGQISGRKGEMGLVIPCGEDCPPVHFFVCGVDTSGETDSVRVRLFKNYCKMTVRLTTESPDDFDVRLRGNVCGYGIYGEPLYGDFSYTPIIGNNGERTILIPRQTDASLMMDLVEENGISRTFSMGEYIVSTGYDWSEPDLRDVDVTIDFVKTELTLKISDWSETVVIDTVL